MRARCFHDNKFQRGHKNSGYQPFHPRQCFSSKCDQAGLAQAASGSGAHQWQTRKSIANQHDASWKRDRVSLLAR
jgi:hypothetical protein